MDSPSSSSSAFNVSFAYSSLLKDETVRETSEEEDVNETDISSSVSPSSSSSSSSEVVGVSLPTAVAYFVLLLALLSVGAVANVVVVVFARWPMRQHRVWLRLAIANLCVVQLFVCVLAAQASATTAILGFFRRPVSADFCSAGCFLLHCGFAATAAGLVLLAVVRGRELEQVCGGGGGDGEAAASAEEAAMGRRAMTAAIALGPWVFGAAMAALALHDFHGSVVSIVCSQAEYVDASSSIGGAAWRIKPSITAVYPVLAALAVVKLTVAYRVHSRRLDRLLASWRERSEQTILLGRSSSQSNRTNRSKRKKRKKGKSKSGQTAVKLSPLAGTGERRPLNLTVDGQANVLCPSQEDVDGAEEEEEDYDDVGTEEDTFDMKMRLKFQKKPRSSERRHTVANIGLPDLSSQRRRSLENGKGRGASSPASDYQYVRKWSVDITALANQLENPKLHTSSYPTLRNTSPGSGSTYGEPGKEEEEDEEEEEEETEQAGTTAGKAGGGGGGGGVAATGSSSVLLLPGMTKFTGRLSTTTTVTTTTKEAYANLETPSIVVSLTPDTEADTLDDDDDDDDGGSSFDAGSRPDSELSGENRRRRPSLALLTLETVGRTPDDKGVIAAREELSEVVRTTVAALVSLVLVLPLTVSDLLEPVTRATFGTNFDVNLRMMATALGLVQGVTVPMLLVWSTKDIREQLATIRDLLQTLRCVCYCNLGPGRSCSIRKRHSKKRQPTV